MAPAGIALPPGAAWVPEPGPGAPGGARGRPHRSADARAPAGRRDNTKLFVRLLVLGCRWAEGRAAAAGQLEALLNQTASFRPAAQLLELLICARLAQH
jgi:hypothetical protein